MSFANRQFAAKMDAVLHTRVVTATCTLKVGGSGDDGLFDNPVNVVNPASDLTLTVPDGVYLGQMLLIAFNGNGSSKTLKVTTTTGTDYTSTTSGNYTLIVWTGTVAGWAKVSGTMT